MTSFVGRAREIADVRALLATTRLLTLTGAGGSGKTRLAVEVAALLGADYAGGIWFVDLAPLATPALVPQAVASALEISEPAGPPQDLADALGVYLHPRQALLVLDNCEHLVPAVGALAARLLQAAPGLRLLATSRQPLGLAHEACWPVPLLAAPDPAQLPDVAQLAQFAAVQLFVERAGLARPGFRLTPENAPALARLCARLDGLPLAIELAAARLRVLSVAQIAGRLDERFRLLTTTAPLPARQQSLRATLDWSYNLLRDPERLLLRALAVFRGATALEAVAAIGSGELDEYATLDLLTALVDQSLVLVMDEGGAARYRLLETVREYAGEQLRASGQLPALRTRHLEWYLAQAERTAPQLRGLDQMAHLAWLEAEHDNFRAALSWSLVEPGARLLGLRLAVALHWFWHMRTYLSEGRGWLAQCLAATADLGATRLRAQALYGAGMLAWAQFDLPAMRALMEESLTLARDLGDRALLADAVAGLAKWADFAGHYDECDRRTAEARRLFRQLGDSWSLAWTLIGAGLAARRAADLATASARFDESIALFREVGDRWAGAIPREYRGLVAYEQHDYALARACQEESLALYRAVGDKWRMAGATVDLARTAHAQGHLGEAAALFQEALRLFQAIGNRVQATRTIALLGHLAAQRGDDGRAARLLGAASSGLPEAAGGSPPHRDEPVQAAARARFGDAAWMDAWRAGERLSFEEAVAYALQAAVEPSTTAIS